MNWQRHLKLILLPCLVLLCVTVPHLEQGDFRRDTCRYAAVGHYMWTDGSLGAPQLGPEKPYFNKPPLALLIHGLFLKWFGIHLVAARFPSILAALGVVALSVLTVRRIGSRSEAIVSGLVLALTYEFFRRTREISLDFWQLFFVMLAVYLGVGALQSGRRRGMMLAGIPFGLALLCKPLVALGVIPVLAAWTLLSRRRQLLLPVFAGSLPVALLVAAPWHLYMHWKFGAAFANRYFLHEVVNRARGLVSVAPPHFYLSQIILNYWPWMLGLLFAICWRWRKAAPRRAPRRDLVMLGGVWVIWAGVLLSLFPDKKPNYALLLYPMLSWISAYGLCRLPWRQLRTWYQSGFRGLAPAAAALLIILSLAPVQFQKPADRNWQALFLWMEENSIAPTRLTGGDLDMNGLCYFYLKTEVWLPDYRPEVVFAAGDDGEQLVLVWLQPGQSKEQSHPRVFESGHLAILKAPRATSAGP